MQNIVVKNTFWYTLGNILPQVTKFILLPVFTYYLTEAEYGIVGSMTAISAVFAIVITLALERAVPRLYFDYKTKDEQKQYLGTIAIGMFVVSTALLGVIFLLRNFIEQIYTSIDFFPYFLISFLTIYFNVFSLLPKIYFQVNQKAKPFIVLSLLQFVSSTISIIVFVIILDQGAVGMLKGQLIGIILLVPLFVIIAIRKFSLKFNYTYLRNSIKFSLPILPAVLSAWILNLSDRIFIERYLSIRDAGIYSVGYQVAMSVGILGTAFFKAYKPYFYKTASQKAEHLAKKELFKGNNIFLVIILSIVFLIALFSYELFYFLFDIKFIDAFKITTIVAIAAFFSQASGLINLSIHQMKRTLQNMYIVIATAVCNIGLNFLFIPTLGLIGAALATLFSFIIFVVIKYIYSKKCFFIPIKWKLIVPLLAFVIFSVLVTYFISYSNMYITILIKLIIVSIFFTGLFIFQKNSIIAFIGILKKK